MARGRSLEIALLGAVATVFAAGCNDGGEDETARASKDEIAAVLTQVVPRLSAGEPPRSVERFYCAGWREEVASTIDTRPQIWLRIDGWSIQSILLKGDSATVKQNGVQTYVTRDGAVYPNSMNGRPPERVRMTLENGAWRVCPTSTVWSRGG